MPATSKTTHRPVAHSPAASHRVARRPKVALGMSGGVDSSLCAHLLVEQGYDATGVFLECWRAPGCRTDADRQDALKVALSLGIPFQVLDFKTAYRNKVVEYFFQEYQAGRTPNPDVMCNREIKFGLFYDWALSHDYEYVATGHYAQVLPLDDQPKTDKTVLGGDHFGANLSTNELSLVTSPDFIKDQTYFLHQLPKVQLPHLLFPIGHLTKTQVRQLARQKNLTVADKKDSVGICFIGDINVHDFLKERLGENPGEVVDMAGHVIGKHQGLWFYTIGQRHGFTLQAKHAITSPDGTTIDKHIIPPFYVIKKKAEKNQLVVGFGPQTYQQRFRVSQLHLVSPSSTSSTTSPLSDSSDLVDSDQADWTKLSHHPQLTVRIRHTGQLLPCRLEPNQTGVVTLGQPIQGIAPGQSAVFYLPHQAGTWTCLGGGVIQE